MKNRLQTIELVCACCGNPFLASRSDARFCSQKCTTEAYGEKVRQKRKAVREARESLGLKAPRRPPPKKRLGSRHPTLTPSCEICGSVFPAARKDARFCSKKCGNVAAERKQKSIRLERLEQKNAALASEGLEKVASNRYGPREKKYVKFCLNCNTAFGTTRNDSRFCSRDCREQHQLSQKHAKRMEATVPLAPPQPSAVHKRTHQLVCSVCKNSFFSVRPDAKFCSAACRDENYLRVKHLRRMAIQPSPKLRPTPHNYSACPHQPSPKEPQPLAMDQALVDLPTLCYLTSISRSAMYRLLQDSPDFPVVKINRSTRFPKEAAIQYIVDNFSSGELSRNELHRRGP